MFRFEPTPIEGLQVITFDWYPDDRGWFAETYRSTIFQQHGIPELVQENCSCSNRGVVRGLHYQVEPCAQGKLIRCVKGSLFDVAVDLRPNSPTYGQHYSLTLNGSDTRMLWVPAGFAHGFCSLEDGTVMLYKTSGYYSKDHERAIRYNDPTLNINWPLKDLIVSPKDAEAKLLGEI